MKNFRLVMLLILNSVAALAATAEGINFENGTWKEITAKAKKENKLIFIDCYTSWCGPCKRLSAEIFPLKIVGDLFNENFINYKVDMEKGEGIALQKKFHVGAFPTLLWINAEGEVIHRALGFMDANALLAEAEKALNGGSSLTELEARYQKDPNNVEYVKAFLQSLVKTADVRAREVTEKYLLLIPKEQYLDADVFELMTKNQPDPFSTAGQYFFEHRSAFEAKFKKTRTDVFAINIYDRYARSLLNQVKDGKELDEKSFQKLIALMENQQFEKRHFLADDLKVSALAYQKDWKAYAAKIDVLLGENRYQNVSSGVLDRWINPVLENDCEEVQVLKSAVAWTILSFKNNTTFSMDRFSKNLVTRIKLLEKIPNSMATLLQAKTELAILQELAIKQEKFAADKAKTIKMIEAMSGKK